MPTPPRTAVSYSRFSDAKQAAGDSAERQERLYHAFCERHSLTPGKEVFADRGRSGYHGEHRKKGRLGELIKAAKEGRFEPGTVIVVEAWDRLGRLRPDRQTELVAELLRTGVSIGICRLDDIFTEDDFGSHKWTTLAVFIQLAHQESKQKAERVSASWEQRRKRAREEGTLLRSNLPAWIELVGDKPQPIKERAAAIRQIFRWAADGMGHTRIIAALQKAKIKPFGEHIVRAERTRSQFSGRWAKPYVALLLRDRRVLGEFQPCKDRKPDGPALLNYFPAVITEEEFNLARAAQEERANRDSLGRRAGPRQGKYVNVFKSMLIHARDGDGFLLHNKGTAADPELILIDARGNGGNGERSYTFPYPVFEEAVLKLMREIDPRTVLPTPDTGQPSRGDILRAKQLALRENLANIKSELSAKYSKALADVLRTTETAEEEATKELQEELARTVKPLARSWEELPTLIDAIRNAPEPDEARLRLRATLRATVRTGYLLIVRVKSWQYAAVQFDFVGGARRHWLIAYQPAAYRRKGGWFTRSFAEQGITEQDLQNPEYVVRLEAAIRKHARK